MVTALEDTLGFKVGGGSSSQDLLYLGKGNPLSSDSRKDFWEPTPLSEGKVFYSASWPHKLQSGEFRRERIGSTLPYFACKAGGSETVRYVFKTGLVVSETGIKGHLSFANILEGKRLHLLK